MICAIEDVFKLTRVLRTCFITISTENLALEHNSLKGSIPSEIGLLTALESKCWCQWHGFAPLRDCSHHSHSRPFYSNSTDSLGLFFNSLTGSVPSEIGLLTALSKCGCHQVVPLEANKLTLTRLAVL